MNTTTDTLQNELLNFIGSETMKAYKGILLSEGALYLADHANAYWIADLISEAQHLKACRGQLLLVLDILAHNGAAFVIISDGDGNTLHTQGVPVANFPLHRVKLFFIDRTLLLPSEY